MSKNNRVNYEDILAKDKLEASSYMIYRKEYRELSSDAKFIYQYILKRFSVTQMKFEEAIENGELEDFTFRDDEDNLFCFVSNDELRFICNISENTVVKAKKELRDVKLLDEVKQSAHKTNRLYLNKIVMDVEDKKKFKEDLNQFRELESKRRKEKNAKRKTKKSLKNTDTTAPESEPQKKEFTEPQKKEFMNRKNYGHSTKEDLSTSEFLSTKESISTKESLKSSSNNNKSINYIDNSDEIKEEEEIILIDPATISYLKNECSYTDFIVNDIIKHMKINKITSFTVSEMKKQKQRIEVYINQNKKEIGEFGLFFVTGILKFAPSRQIIEREHSLKKHAELKKKQETENNFIEQFFSEYRRLPSQDEIQSGIEMAAGRKSVPFYNWLEQ